MFKVTKVGENRLDVELSGKITADEMRTALDELVAKSEGIENGLMLYDVIDFHLPTLGAIGIELSRLPAMFGFVRKFSRAAVLADKRWLQMVSQIEGALIPGLHVKAFSHDQRAEAEAWLAGGQQ